MAQDLDALLEREKKLEEQLAEVREKMVDLKKARRDELLAELKELGFDGGKVSKKSAAGSREKKDAPCSVCEFKTDPLHDARAHRSQGKTKKPFTAEELRERGMKKA